MKKYVTIFLFFAYQACYTQSANLIDSLKTQVLEHQKDTLAVIALNDLAWYYRPIDTDSALYFANLSIKKGSALNYSIGVAQAYNNIGLTYNDIGEYEISLQNHLKALSIREKINDKKGIASSYNNIGILYKLQNNFSKSLEYYELSLKIRREINDQYGTAAALNNIGNVYAHINDTANALKCYYESLGIRERINDTKGIAVSLNNLANYFYESGNNQKALDYYLKSLVIAKEIGNAYGICSTLNNIGSMYCVMKQNDKALDFLNRSLEMAKNTQAKEVEQECYNWLAQTYAQLGKFNDAYKYHQLFSALKDSVFQEESNLRFHEMEAKYGKKKNEEQIELLKQKDIKNKIIIYSCITGAIFILLLAGLIFSQFRVKKKLASVLIEQKHIVEEKNNELERLSIVARETENVILIMDAEGRLEWVNASFERLNAITLAELKKLKGETIYEVSNNPKIREIVEEAVKNRKPITYESLNVTSDGQKVWESSTLSPIFNDKGELRKIIIIDSDITDRKNAEELIHEKNKEILDSIHYALRIQRALITNEVYINKTLNKLIK